MAQVKEGPNYWAIFAILLVVAGGIYTFGGYAPESVEGGIDNNTATPLNTVSTTGTVTAVAPAGILKLDSEFLTLATTDNDSAAVIIADVDSTNFDTDKSKITLQLNAVVDSTTSSGNTTFTLKARNNTGISVILLNRTEAGTLTAPTAAMTKTMTLQFTETLTSGFTSTEQVLNHIVLASAPMLKGTPTDSAALYSPIVVQTADTNIPEIKIDSTKGSHAYLWTTATTVQTISVTFDISFIDIRYMTEISDSQPITITAIGSDGAPYTIEIIRNDSI